MLRLSLCRPSGNCCNVLAKQNKHTNLRQVIYYRKLSAPGALRSADCAISYLKFRTALAKLLAAEMFITSGLTITVVKAKRE